MVSEHFIVSGKKWNDKLAFKRLSELEIFLNKMESEGFKIQKWTW